jgi:hypothetical protein
MITQDFLCRLDSYIAKAFNNEEKFIKRFFMANAELLECYMASERSWITVLVESGAHVTTTIDTTEFIEWCNTVDAE